VAGLRHSTFAVGALGIANLVPTLSIGLFGGSLADATDRRKLVLVTSGCMAAVSGLFAVQAFGGNRQVWVLYLLQTLEAMLAAINAPARRTFTPRLLRPNSCRPDWR
jgi:MFS family permease